MKVGDLVRLLDDQEVRRNNGEIPPDVKKQGAFAIANWLKANPEAARKLSQSLR